MLCDFAATSAGSVRPSFVRCFLAGLRRGLSHALLDVDAATSCSCQICSIYLPML